MRYYSIIYEAIDDVKQMMRGMLQPEIKETIVGMAQVREVFRSSKFGVVAGCLVTEGCVKRNNPIRVLRDNVVIFEGALESLRRFKDDVSEVRAGTECGIGVKNYQDVRVGDQIECYSRVEVATNAVARERMSEGLSTRHSASKQQMQRVLSELIPREVQDPRVGNVTITAVQRRARSGLARRCTSCRSLGSTPREVQRGLDARGAASCAARSGARCGCATRRELRIRATTSRSRAARVYRAHHEGGR